MGRLSDLQRREKARNTLIQTVAKIYETDPTLGRKWQAGMVNYYIGRLAELLIQQSGIEESTPELIEYFQTELMKILLVDNKEGK